MMRIKQIQMGREQESLLLAPVAQAAHPLISTPDGWGPERVSGRGG